MRRIAALAAATLFATGAVVGQAGAVVDVSSFTVTAQADALAVEVVAPAVPLFPQGEITYATPGTAQASVDSLGESTGFASSPYPGASIAGIPSLVNGIAGSYGAPPLPSYPFIVNSSYPATPVATQSDGAISLRSSSSANQSAATAATGLSSPTGPQVTAVTATATASVDPSTGNMTATAANATDGFTLGSTLKIGDISSSASLTRSPGQAPVVHTAFSVGSVTVDGVTVGFTNEGFELGPTAVPTLTPAVLAGLLSGAGITLTYLPSTRTADGIDSAGLEITESYNVPGQGGATQLEIILGRVSVSAPAVVAGGGAAAVSPPSAPVPSAPVAGAPPVAPGVVALASPAVSAPQPSTGSAVAAPTAAPLPPVAIRPATPAAVLLANPFLGDLSGRFYLILVVAAALLVLATAGATWRRRRARPGGASVLNLPGS
jgi:hypothetical protein